LVTKDHKPFCCKGLRRHDCIFAIKKTNPNEPKPPHEMLFKRPNPGNSNLTRTKKIAWRIGGRQARCRRFGFERGGG
jgi:hypothetical protein